MGSTPTYLKWAMALLAIFVFAASTPARAQQQQPTPRSRATAGNDARSAHMHCLFQTTAAYASYAGPQAAREAGQAAFMMSCVLQAMPADWSSAPEYSAQAQRLAAMARQSDPQIDACLVSDCNSP